jgi:hypothetical protein
MTQSVEPGHPIRVHVAVAIDLNCKTRLWCTTITKAQ